MFSPPTELGVPPTVVETPEGANQILEPGLIQSAVGFDIGVGGSSSPFGVQSVEALTPFGLQTVVSPYEVETTPEVQIQVPSRVGIREVPDVPLEDEDSAE